MEKGKSTKLALLVVLAAVALAIGVWVVMGQNADAPSSESAPVSTTENTDNAENSSENETPTSNGVTITFTNNGFSPQNVTVKKGETVTVKNESDTRVQFSSDDHPTHRLNTEMNLRTLGPGESASFTAETVGTHGFHDHIDDSKTGTLVVTD